jgi:hypothetical protein
MNGCVEIMNYPHCADLIARMNMTAQSFTSANLKKRVNNSMMDGEFKMPLPKRRNIARHNEDGVMTDKQGVAARIAAKRLVQARHAFILVQKAKFEMLKVRANRKKNSCLFIMRMKYLASLPENQNAKFHIPMTLIQYG